MLKKQAFLIAIVYTALLTWVSLISINNVSKEFPDFSDKVFHFIAYALLTFLWICAYVFKFKWSFLNANTIAMFSCIAFGIIIELLQKNLTTYRAFEWNDVLANSLGVVFLVLLVKFNIFNIKKI